MGTLAEHLATSQPFAELLGPGLAHWVAIHVDDLPQDVSKMDVALHYEDKDQVLQTIPEGFAATALLIEQLQGSGEQYSLLDLATARPTRVQTI